MLKQRVITAIVLVTLVLISLYLDNPIYWRALITAAILIAFWEWIRFCQIESPVIKALSYAVFGVCLYGLQARYIPLSLIVPALCVVWAILIFFTMTDKLDFIHNRFIKLLIGIAVLSSSSLIVIELKYLPNGPLWILCFMAAVWAADIGAYFVGKRFGKTKLAPKVSPGKTVEGLLGGLGFMLLIFVPLLFLTFSLNAAFLLLITVLITALVSVAGDLFESKMKRFSGLKDSSNILPGHGGVLDRIDSLLSGAPFFALGLIILGYLY